MSGPPAAFAGPPSGGPFGPLTCPQIAQQFGAFALIRACHADEYRAIQISLLVIAGFFFICAVLNLILLVKRVGWANRAKNMRVHTHIISSVLLVVGLFAVLLYFQNLWNYWSGARRWVSSIMIFIAMYIAYTIFIITVVHWYYIMVALKASVDRKPLPAPHRFSTSKVVFTLWGIIGVIMLAICLWLVADASVSGFRVRSRVNRSLGFFMSTICSIFVTVIGIRSVLLFREIKRQRSEVMGSMSRTTSGNDALIAHQMKIILSTTVFFVIVLILTAIQAAVMFAFSFESMTAISWETLRNRMLLDTCVILSLYLVLLVCYRYNRDSPSTMALWNSVLSTVRERFTSVAEPDLQDGSGGADGTVVVADAAEVRFGKTGDPKEKPNDNADMQVCSV